METEQAKPEVRPQGVRGASITHSPLLGLPEGVHAVAYRRPATGEFSITGNDGLHCWERDADICQLIVAPNEGFDIVRVDSFSSPMFKTVRIVRKIDPKTVVIHFTVSNSHEEEQVRKLSDHPQFLKIQD